MTPEELRERRTDLGLSQNRLAHVFGVAPSTVARWEQNANPISVPTLVRLALEQLEMKANYPANYELKDCAWCKGKGQLNGYQECRSCNGTGSVLAPKPAKPCQRCEHEGNGKSGVYSHEPCPYCAGTGWTLSLSRHKNKKRFTLSTALLSGENF